MLFRSHMQADLVIGGHVYHNTNGEEITEDDISPEFLENNTNYCCTAFFKDTSGEDIEVKIQNLYDTLASRAEVKDIKYISSDDAWEEFQNDYFAGNEDAAEGFADDNPLINSKHLEIYTHNQDELDIIVDYLQNIDFVGNVNVSSKTIKNDSFI